MKAEANETGGNPQATIAQPDYQRRDHRVVDYQQFQLPGMAYQLRGPKPHLSPGSYFACLGAAQTFGCFCARPFPSILSEQLGLETLNLGYGGAGPAFFLRDKQLLEYVDNARFAIVQIMSGRSADNSEFKSEGLAVLQRRLDGKRIHASNAWIELLREESALTIPIGRRQFHLFAERPQRVRRLVAETRASWLDDTIRLLQRLRIPTVLFYFSKREPDYRERYWNADWLLNDFPQFVNQHMIDEVKGHADAYVECVTRRGIPQPLTDRETGTPVKIDLSLAGAEVVGQWHRNPYYPSPEMHEDAAVQLTSICEQLK